MTHGTTSTYNRHRCRCDECRKASARYQRARRAKLFKPTNMPHGTVSTYSNYRCRCDECRKAAAKQKRLWRAKCLNPTNMTHGTTSTYSNHRCRCDECRKASANYQRTRKARKAHAKYGPSYGDKPRPGPSYGDKPSTFSGPNFSEFGITLDALLYWAHNTTDKCSHS